ncbi:MAG: alkaline phosphatase family protein [Kineosporiaceae bacterium]
MQRPAAHSASRGGPGPTTPAGPAAATTDDTRSWRSGLAASSRDARDAAVGLLPTAFAVWVADQLLDDLTLRRAWTPLAVAALVAVGDGFLRPVLRGLAGRLGAVAALGLGVAAQLALVRLAFAVLPGVVVHTLGAAAWTLVVVALVGASTRWLLGVNDSSYLVADLLRRAESRRRRRGASTEHADGRADTPGLVVVQVDGMPAPLLEHGIVSGTLPTLARWVRSGSHDAVEYWARVPSTTPASQAALLHGSSDGIPAFRWYEKGSGRLVVTNRPADATLVEARLSDGRGLLAGGGVSISNMFTGDAATSLMVMSRAGARGGLGPGGDYVRFFASPFVFVRALLLTLGEMLKELYQGRQQRIRGIEPRIRRSGAYVALRGVTNAMLRDLNVALVAEHMMRGAPVIMVDFVDYDEIAHHAGVARPEALDALAGIDRVLSTLERVAGAARREYRFVVLSDHGQSQGPTFRQLAGHTLEDAVGGLVGAGAGDRVVSTTDAESWGPVNALLSEVLGSTAATSRWASRRPGTPDGSVVLGPKDHVPATAPDGDERPALVVVGSGNLGLVWFPRLPGRVGVETLQEQFPALVPGLLAEPGVGFLVVDSTRGPLAVGRDGVHVLADSTVEGTDPLLPFGPRAAPDLLRVATAPNCPDLYVHSTVSPRALEVHAFEELVGCHGGLGGWQNRACLVHPADWPLDDDLVDRSVPGEAMLYGADVVHRQLVRWLERAGTRRPVRDRPVPEPAVADGPAAP